MDGNASDDHRAAIRALKTFYRTGRDDLSRDFFTPCLQRCGWYKRAAGYFSSSALKTWSGSLVRLLADQVDIRLLICPELSEQDGETLKLATNDEYRKSLLVAMADHLIEEAFALENSPDDVVLRLRLMAWMVVSGQLNIQFAMPRHIEDAGIFHEKSGIFGFPWGERIAFVGSANESHSGHIRNYEKVVVFRDWIADDATRVNEIESDFDLQWSGGDETLLVIPLSEKSTHLIRTRAPIDRPASGITATGKVPNLSAISDRWRHQGEAAKAFIATGAGILEMATGTGKTNTALRIAQELLGAGQIQSVVVCTEGTDLLDQWFRTIVTWEVAQARELRVLRHYGEHHQGQSFALAPSGAVLIVSRGQLKAVLVQLEAAAKQAMLIIHDEVHGLGAPQCIRDLKGLQQSIKLRLGLSATPEREYDQAGSEFVEQEIGPVLYQFGLKEAIERGILVEFDYVPLDYELTADDKKRLASVYSKKVARQKEGKPMSNEELWTELSRVYKTAEEKPYVFANYLSSHSDLVRGAIIFVEERWYGDLILPVLDRYTHLYRTYYAEDDRENLLRFARGEIECLVTCHRISQGIDIQALRAVVLLSSARARLETIQRIGRCLRMDPTHPEKRACVVDFVRRSDPMDESPENGDELRANWLTELSQVKRKE
jgi:superfamily II DNA or RNA helicase